MWVYIGYATFFLVGGWEGSINEVEETMDTLSASQVRAKLLTIRRREEVQIAKKPLGRDSLDGAERKIPRPKGIPTDSAVKNVHERWE